MGKLVEFLAVAFQEGVFQWEYTPEQLLETLKIRPSCDEYTIHFLKHTSKTALLNLTVVEILAGKRSAAKMDSYGLDWLQAKVLAAATDVRVARIVREAQYWDHLASQSTAQAA